MSNLLFVYIRLIEIKLLVGVRKLRHKTILRCCFAVDD